MVLELENLKIIRRCYFKISKYRMGHGDRQLKISKICKEVKQIINDLMKILKHPLIREVEYKFLIFNGKRCIF